MLPTVAKGRGPPSSRPPNPGLPHKVIESMEAQNQGGPSSMEANHAYPHMELEDYEPRFLSDPVFAVADKLGDGNVGGEENAEATSVYGDANGGSIVDNKVSKVANHGNQSQRRYFFYDSPYFEETGPWIPVSVPPVSINQHMHWEESLSVNGGYLPDEDMGWNQFLGEDKQLTMWDVFTEMAMAAGGKVKALASADFHKQQICRMSSYLLEEAWKEMAQTLTEASMINVKEIIEAEPPRWIPDSASSTCMLCNVRFHPFMCSRHHCRFCGGLFCGECSKGRSLLPVKFRTQDPERVCDVCCVRLDSVQAYLMDQVSRAAQLPTHDLTDLSTLRSWFNFPWGQSMEYEIYKAANIIRCYNKVGRLSPEKEIPEAILKQAKGLAILTVAKVGTIMTYKVGTGLVVSRLKDGTWSAPSAISSFGIGWGAQAGVEFTDFIIVLRTMDAVMTFGGNVHLSVGAGVGVAAGIIGRVAEADIRAGDGGLAACYTYSCSKGAFVGCALEGSIFTTRTRENSRFYGNSSINASDILLGKLPKPPAASILYEALSNIFEGFGI